MRRGAFPPATETKKNGAICGQLHRSLPGRFLKRPSLAGLRSETASAESVGNPLMVEGVFLVRSSKAHRPYSPSSGLVPDFGGSAELGPPNDGENPRANLDRLDPERYSSIPLRGDAQRAASTLTVSSGELERTKGKKSLFELTVAKSPIRVRVPNSKRVPEFLAGRSLAPLGP